MGKFGSGINHPGSATLSKYFTAFTGKYEKETKKCPEPENFGINEERRNRGLHITYSQCCGSGAFLPPKKGMTTNFFHPCLSLLFLDPGSEIRDG
jgi:hypothetical protein